MNRSGEVINLNNKLRKAAPVQIQHKYFVDIWSIRNHGKYQQNFSPQRGVEQRRAPQTRICERGCGHEHGVNHGIWCAIVDWIRRCHAGVVVPEHKTHGEAPKQHANHPNHNENIVQITQKLYFILQNQFRKLLVHLRPFLMLQASNLDVQKSFELDTEGSEN